MRILKSGQNQTWLTIQAVDGALYSVFEDEPVFITIRTNQEIASVRNNLSNFELEYLGVSIPLQLVDIEIVHSLNLLSGGGLYTYRLLCKKSNTDFTPKSWYKQQYITLNNRYGHLSGQLQVAEYEVTNLLGSYGSFSVDSDNDGLADGWSKLPEAADVYQLQNGVQYMKRTVQKNTVAPALWQSKTTPANLNDRFFLRASAKVSSTANDMLPGRLYIASFNAQNHEIWSNVTVINYTVNRSSFETRYTSFQVTDTSAVGVGVFGFYLEHTTYNTLGSINEAWVDNVILVNLTTMGELPQALKQFFATSNITKFEDLAIFGKANVMCILKDANGNYITKKGNDWLNDLIPYVENTAIVRMPVYW